MATRLQRAARRIGSHAPARPLPYGRGSDGRGSDARARRRRGFSYVEAVLSTLILGGGIATGLQLYGTFARGASVSVEGMVAQQLASDLLAEIVAKDFEGSVFGPAASETTRRDFNDVDDYDTWTESPPEDLDGNPLDAVAYAGYERLVRVINVDQTDLKTVAADNSTAAKAIIVIVSRHGKERVRLTAIRTRHDGYD